jgi:hypothetical protein
LNLGDESPPDGDVQAAATSSIPATQAQNGYLVIAETRLALAIFLLQLFDVL